MLTIDITLPEETHTQQLGQAMAQALLPGLTMYLHGDLGAGKTTLTRALVQASGYQGRVKSPTYTLAEPYDIVLNEQPLVLVHFDLYRMADPEEFLDAGFREHFNERDICIVEWPEKGQPVLPDADIHITLSVHGTGRQVQCRASSDKGQQCLTRLKQWAPEL